METCLIDNFNARGWELAILHPTERPYAYNGRIAPSTALSEFLQSKHPTISFFPKTQLNPLLDGCGFLFVVALVDGPCFELGLSISQKEFDALKALDEALAFKWFVHDAHQNAYRLVLPHAHFVDLRVSLLDQCYCT